MRLWETDKASLSGSIWGLLIVILGALYVLCVMLWVTLKPK